MGPTHVVRRCSCGVVAEGEYEQELCCLMNSPSGYWYLRRYRVTVDGVVGQWRTVHGNQRKPVAGFPVSVRNPGWKGVNANERD